jgi:C-terminal AAA-associated domain
MDERTIGRIDDQSEERYLELLKELFSDDEAWAQLETIIDWGRYAELFSYVEDRGIFRQDMENAETWSESEARSVVPATVTGVAGE